MPCNYFDVFNFLAGFFHIRGPTSSISSKRKEILGLWRVRNHLQNWSCKHDTQLLIYPWKKITVCKSTYTNLVIYQGNTTNMISMLYILCFSYNYDNCFLYVLSFFFSLLAPPDDHNAKLSFLLFNSINSPDADICYLQNLAQYLGIYSWNSLVCSVKWKEDQLQTVYKK